MARDCDRRDDRASLFVAAEAESVLLDRKADVRACVGVCVSNKDESGHTTRTYITLHTISQRPTPV